MKQPYFRMSFRCDTAAFEKFPDVEISRILDVVAQKITNGKDEGAIMDVCGNKVGEFYFTRPPQDEEN